jgi:hypothetical protein
MKMCGVICLKRSENPLAECVSIGFAISTVHGFRFV